MAIGCASVVGIIGFAVLNSGTILYAKVTSNNLAHDESRVAVMRLVNDIHKAVSTPQLWDASATATNGLLTVTNATTKASCVSFQIVPPNGGPYEIRNDPGNPNLIQVQYMTGGFNPSIGQRLIIPMYDIENDIIRTAAVGSHRNIWMANGEERIPKSQDGTKTISYFTTRVFYAVENGELRMYMSGMGGNGILTPAIVDGKLVIRNAGGAAASRTTIARFITTPQPFTVPSFPDRRYVGVNLTTEESRFSNRGYKATNTLIAGSIPFRARLCNSL